MDVVPAGLNPNAVSHPTFSGSLPNELQPEGSVFSKSLGGQTPRNPLPYGRDSLGDVSRNPGFDEARGA